LLFRRKKIENPSCSTSKRGALGLIGRFQTISTVFKMTTILTGDFFLLLFPH
jgi:hypothetical protein